MKLDNYLNDNNMTQQMFVEDLLVATGRHIPQGTLSKYVLGTRIPNIKNMQAIYEYTQGKVTPNDFYNIS